MKKNLFLDIHAIHTVPPSNINRDDTGSPKTAKYGGVTRARVSSQAWKRAVRMFFRENGNLANVGIRSLEIVRYIAGKIIELDSNVDEKEAVELANSVLKSAGIRTKDNKTRALFFISSKQAMELAEAAINGEKTKKELQEILKSNPAIDIALFGRMVAENPSLNEDASCQFAHAISTHGVETEFDYFTAIDDFSSKEDAGAGMLGTVEFNSSTLYRYANVAVHEFLHQIGDVELTTNSLRLFVEGFIKSMPTGKVNTFANQTLPSAVLINLRKDRPVNLVTAFERPINSIDGYEDKSIEKLYMEFKNTGKWLEDPILSLSLGMDDFYENKENLGEFLFELEESLNELLSDLKGEK